MSRKPPRLQTLQPRIQELDRTSRVKSLTSARHSRLYNYEWQKARAEFLKEHPLCQCPACDGGRKRLSAANVVDHDPPHRGDLTKFWDRSTWRAMAKACHDRKTATQDGGFGNSSGR